MEDFKKHLAKRLSKKNLTNLSIGAFVLKEIENFFHQKVKINWKLKNGIAFVVPTPLSAKTEIFLNKKEIINHVNTQLNNFWFEVEIKDIIIKSS